HWPSTQVSGVGTPLLATRPSTCGAAEALDAGIPTAAMALRAANSAERSDITKTLPRLAAGDGPSSEASPRGSRAPPTGETVRHKEHGRRHRRRHRNGEQNRTARLRRSIQDVGSNVGRRVGRGGARGAGSDARATRGASAPRRVANSLVGVGV